MDFEKLMDLMDAFIAEQTDAFTLKEGLIRLRKQLHGKRVPHLADMFEDMLVESGMFFIDDRGKEKYFVPRHAFFAATHFRIMPTRDEIREGILVPGHRFVPFCHAGMPSYEVTLLDDRDGLIPKKVVRKSLESLYIFHSLLGSADMLHRLIEDQESNADRLMDLSEDSAADTEVDLTVFDLSAFYAHLHVQEGDCLTVEVLDWSEGLYGIRHTPASELDASFSASREWCEALEKSLLNVFEQFGCMRTIPEQLALAYYHGNPVLNETPGIGFGAFLKQSNTVELAKMGDGQHVLWRKGESPLDDISRSVRIREEQRTGSQNTLNGILQDIGMSCSETELEAHFLDAFSRGETDPGKVMSRIFGSRESLQFCSEKQLAGFNRLLTALWNKTGRSYNVLADAAVAPCRGKALELLGIQTDYLRSLDKRGVMPEQLPGEVIFEFGKISSLLEEALRLFNQPVDVGSKEAESFMHSFELMEIPIRTLIEEMEAHLEGQNVGLRILETPSEGGVDTEN